MVARRPVDRVSLAKERWDLDRAIRGRRRATSDRFRVAPGMDTGWTADRLHIRCGRYGGAIDFVDRASRWHEPPPADEAGRAARRAFEAVCVADGPRGGVRRVAR